MISNDKSEYSNEFVIKEKVNIQGLEQSNLIDTQTSVSVANLSITDSKITYTGNIDLNFIYNSGNVLNSRNVKVPFEVSTENRQNSSSINVDYDISLKEIKYDFKSEGNLQIEAILEINTKISNNVNISIIDNIQIEDKNQENDDYDSLILYIVKPEDTLWKIAKRFNSTIDDIARMNGIEDTNKTDVGQKLYIPKFNYIKREKVQNVSEPTFV